MNSFASGMHAAVLLARGRAEGLLLLNRRPDDAMALAARSFWAMALAIPGFVALHLIDWAASGDGAWNGRDFAADLLGYIIGWLAFALISHRIATVIGRAALWPRFITAWNWCNVLQYFMLVVGSLPALLGLPDWLVQTCWLVATGWALWLEYFTTRVALALPRGAAIGMVLVDVVLGVALALGMAGVS